ncbi:Probable replication-associated protein RepA2 (plasmid) [Candidatus Erwinia haradaeae]|uniref:Probable replication-associated protein RepA2 n=1 Tax=Candidatus Erwinia haradaeae TaxID=1922217 RepID=A0A451D311_9GAMM|nr:Replication protein [Candidatus Erwinia haradaeae]VFP80034.1 Probable replication-associated protein RepA2 [Candidatus Erwinia haradaeae]VFP80083.1 Probable replication-associated protein RepA2 [Candidatus Erwinia haradaeae]
MNDNTVMLQESDQVLYRQTRRGEANCQRKGQVKIHRNHKPQFTGKIPRGMAAKVMACIKNHDWRQNSDLIALRRNGYTPYSRIFDRSYQPKPLRITARSESREALSALSLTLAANCDYSPYSQYMFEVILPIAEIAQRMGVLHVYNNGRKAYDVLLHALRVLEQLDYVIVHRGRESDSGQNKPMRVFLTENFFTSRGMNVESVRQWLHKYRQWAISAGISVSLRNKYERHQLKMARLGIDIDRHHSLKNRLKSIKRWVVSPELFHEKESIIADLNTSLIAHKKQRISSRHLSEVRYQMAWWAWSASDACTPVIRLNLENAIKTEFPHLLNHATSTEQYYRLLLERAGIPLP